MTPGCAIRGYVFDAYGTLFDVHSVVEAGRTITSDPMTLSTMWRQKQLEYTWLRALMGRYEDFWTITEAALRYTVRRLGLVAGDAEIARLMAAYLSLACFPEVRGAIERLDGRPASRPVERLSADAPRRGGLRGSRPAPIPGPLGKRGQDLQAGAGGAALGPEALGLPNPVVPNAWTSGANLQVRHVSGDYALTSLDQLPR